MDPLTKPTHSFKVNHESENLLLLGRDLAVGASEWYSRPTEIEFSFNNLCNLKCIMCGKADDEPNFTMDRETGVRALNEILPSALHLTPSANSEPFMNDMGLIYDLCEKHNLTLFLFTNGMLCTEERFRKIQPRVHRLWFSFDSHVRETYEMIRAGAVYDRVLENIKQTLRMAAEDDTEITFHFVLMRINLEQLPDYVKFISNLGGTQIKVTELLPNSHNYHDLKVENGFSDSEISAVLDRALAAANEEKLDLTLALKPPFTGGVRNTPIRYKSKSPIASLRELHMETFSKIYPHFCNMAAHYLKVTPEGDVFPCCRAPSVLKMGNIRDLPFEEIWNGPTYRRFREMMFSRDYHEVCSACSVLTGNPYYPGC